MSGGSFNYLCFKKVADLMEDYGETADDFKMMNEYLREYGYSDIAEDGEKIISEVKELQKRFEKLHDVYMAVEWYKSNDWGIDSVHEAAKEYRELK